MESEWIKAQDGTEARRDKDVIEVRMTGRIDSTAHKLTKDNEPGFRAKYPDLFKASRPATDPKPMDPKAPAKVVAPVVGKKKAK